MIREEVGAAAARRAPVDGGRWRPAETWAALGILAALSVLCCGPLMASGWYQSHEVLRPIARVLAAYHEIVAGDLYPRWASTAYLGKGAPLFNFYPPAFSFLAAYAHALGVPLLVALKAVIGVLFFVGALGTFLWARPHLGHYGALVAAVLYLFAPYHFVNVYVRGAVAEFAALAPLPFVFRGIDLLLERTSARGLATLAISSGAVVLSHFLAALMVAPIAVAYAAVRAVRRVDRLRALGRVALGGVAGAAVSAPYWLPAMLEVGALSAERLRTNNADYLSPYIHFVEARQWFDTTWGFGSSLQPGYPDEMSFQIGVVALAAVGATLSLAWWSDRRARAFVLLALGLGCWTLWFTHASSAPWYRLLTPYEMVQFPWRFLGISSLFAAAVGGGFVQPLAARWRALGPAAAAAVIAAAIAFSGPHRAVAGVLPLADETRALDAAVAADLFSAKFGNSDEYLPKNAEIEAANFRQLGQDPWGIGAEVGAVRAGRGEVTFEVKVAGGEAIVVVPWHAFPGWKATVDGQARPVTAGPDGLLALWVPSGIHRARVYFGTTPARAAGWSLAILGLGALVAVALRERFWASDADAS